MLSEQLSRHIFFQVSQTLSSTSYSAQFCTISSQANQLATVDITLQTWPIPDSHNCTRSLHGAISKEIVLSQLRNLWKAKISTSNIITTISSNGNIQTSRQTALPLQLTRRQCSNQWYYGNCEQMLITELTETATLGVWSMTPEHMLRSVTCMTSWQLYDYYYNAGMR